MYPSKSQRWQISEIFISLFVFLILSSYTYALWFLDPYPGFSFNSSTGQITEIYFQPQQKEHALQVDDVLFQVGPVLWETYKKDSRVLLFGELQPGDVIKITVIRNEEKIIVPWKFIGFDQNILNTRLVNIWGLSFVFFFIGAAGFVLLRPRDLLRNLFIAMNYLTALWLIFGMLSYSHLWFSSILLHASSWLLLPIYLHFHWIFPRPLKQLPKTLVTSFYFICSCFAIAEFFQALPKSLYALAFLIALIGSFILQIIHYRKHQDQRTDIKLLAIALAVAFLPPIMLGVLITTGSTPNIAALGLISLPFMPLAYFYVIYRRRMGGLEIRLNQIISIYLFLILCLIALFILVLPLLNLNLQIKNFLIINIIITSILIAIAITTFPSFQKFVEKRYLGINLDTKNLAQIFSDLIVTNTNLESLLQLLEKDVFPSLLIRQYAVVQVENHHLNPLLMKNVTHAQLPDKEAIEIAKYVSTDDWLRLILPLKLDNSTLGFFLLGSRDPDDIYHQQEIPSLQSIANQTAIALSNIAHAETLRAMYKSGLERYDQERLRLGRDLHDSVLNDLSEFRKSLGEDNQKIYNQVADHLREIVKDLRPQMLIYGLEQAISGLAEDLMQKTNNQLKILVEVESTDERLPENIEIHLFRIVQEACKNTLRHANASLITISGLIFPNQVDLVIEDNGIGFELKDKGNLDAILASQHFGLVGMLERAHIIGGKINLQSQPNYGTKIQIQWSYKER